MKIGVVVGFVIAGITCWYFPGFNGYTLSPSSVSDGEGRIAAAVFWVGAAVVWFMPDKGAT